MSIRASYGYMYTCTLCIRRGCVYMSLDLRGSVFLVIVTSAVYVLQHVFLSTCGRPKLLYMGSLGLRLYGRTVTPKSTTPTGSP